MRNILTTLCIVLFVFANAKCATTEDDEYTKVIRGRADKIVDELTFDSNDQKIRVRDLIMDHYRFLNDAEESRNADVAEIREEFADNTELRNAKIDLRKAEQELKIRDHHFAFNAELKLILTEEQIDGVKNGLTYNVCPNTFAAFQDMIQNLKPEEKEQIHIWLLEAREHAIDGGSSKEKHGWFGKYKGRINNYLSKQGYDLNKLSEEWHDRMRAKGIEL
ncbi:DUF3826 domain-containing protein [Marinilabiliaceae bacterium AAT]|uniref:DUF3826 domain-containing protein n=2 Tax=Plebeiibacterium sediminum TaxID=2992112 RepID=A0AAE3M2M3_9BACT|nr:DUF3826 domain-containing protein [Plebeiobacterium sediminum]